MKQGGRFAVKSAGFTVIETMIVLAVSAGLFLIAAIYVGGKQAKTEFQVGVRSIQTEIQQIINQTESGYYGTRTNKDCSYAGASSDLSFTGSASLGSSGNCIFIGKAIVADTTKLSVYPLAGARQVAGEDTADPVTARATVAGASDVFVLPNGISFVSSSVNGASLSAGVRGFAVLNSMASATGSQTFDLYGFHTLIAGPGGNYEDSINQEKDKPTPYASEQSVSLCMKSGATDQSALITIGGAGGLAVHTYIKNGQAC